VEASIRAAGGELLRGVTLFDVYAGPPLAESERSLAWRLTFSAPDRTLTDAEVETAMAAITSGLTSAVGGRVRA
jgi:phenylalanyl-tRNA synthetase beta chain